MPRKKAVPSYRHFKPRDLACVDIKGKRYYLGPYNSPESKQLYAQLIQEHFGDDETELARRAYTVSELIVAFWKYAQEYYNGGPHLYRVKAALKPLRELYGSTSASEFGPVKLEKLQGHLVEQGHSRTYINCLIGDVKRCFRFAERREMVARGTWWALKSVPDLKAGRTKARETEPVKPVSDDVVKATLPFLRPEVADMVRIARMCGARPGEICDMRPADIDRTTDPWEYRPRHHKTRHHGKDRVVLLGPPCQEILSRYLLRPAAAYCFAMRRDSFRRAIARACERAFGMPEHLRRIKTTDAEGKPRPKAKLAELKQQAKEWRAKHVWAPNQLRHAAGTDTRRKHGLEGAQVQLGHSRADVTQVYAERDLELARRIAAEQRLPAGW